MAHSVVLFDGECGFCQQSVTFIWQHDPAGRFHFAPLQSALGRRLLAERGVPEPDLRTFFLVDGDRVLERSDAALEIAAHLNAPWRWLAVARVIPRPLRNLGYALVAINRHWLPGKSSCALPPPEVRARFLDASQEVTALDSTAPASAQCP